MQISIIMICWIRTVLVEKGWKPLAISSEGLKDVEQFNAFLEEIREAVE